MYLYPKRNREYIYESGKKLRLGDELSFVYEKNIFLDNKEFMLLTSENFNKYLIPFDYYKSYGFIKGQKIKGWIDKINCSGRIFIEPFHPYYNVNHVYNFDFVRISDNANQSKIIVSDIFNNEIEIDNSVFNNNLPLKIACRVDKIKKGKLYLSIFK